jgi:DNA-directed RNA polymerase subunit delta
MLRRIIDFSKLTDQLLSLLNEKFPEGIDDDAVFSIENSKGERLSVVEVRDEENIFLVKVNAKMEAAMEDFDEDVGEPEPDEVIGDGELDD